MTSIRLVVLLALVFMPQAMGHGWMVEPEARNAQPGPQNGYCPHCGNGNGICGDGNQWPFSSDYLNYYNGPVKTWTAGTVVEVEVKVTAHHKGHYEFSICDQVINGSLQNAQACLDKWALERATPEEAGLTKCAAGDRRPGCQPIDPRHPERFYLPPPGFSVDGGNTHRMYLKVPQDLACDACTLQWRWWSANSCIPASDYSCYASELSAHGFTASSWGLGRFGCPGGGCDRCGCGEEFRNCADITVLPSAAVTTTLPGTVPTTAPTTLTTPSPTPIASPTNSPTAPPTPISSGADGGGEVVECVSHSVLTCINGASNYWPECDPDQMKTVTGPEGYEFGDYCTQEWTDALNVMLSDPAVNKCQDKDAIHKFLAQVAYETGYYSTVYQPQDGGAGLIHMIPGNWPVNAQDMDTIFPGNNYELIASAMGKDFFQSAEYGWKSVAAWFKVTNRVIPGCDKDLFDESFDEQTRCILSRVVSRQEAFDIVGACLDQVLAPTPTPTPEPEPEPEPAPTELPTSVPTVAPTTRPSRIPTAAPPTSVSIASCRHPDCGCPPFVGGATWCNEENSLYGSWCQESASNCVSTGAIWCAAGGRRLETLLV